MRRLRPRGGRAPRLRRFSPADILLTGALFAACAALVAVLPRRSPDPPVSGRAYAIDGDSLRLGQRDIRLLGIDAPELHQSCDRYGERYECGRLARSELAALLARGPANCHGEGSDKYGRVLAVCQIGGEDVNAALVRGGAAVSYGRYEHEEQAARTARRGIWAGTFEKPEDWRRRHPRSGADVDAPPSAAR
ncbi:thermonuclease family protein [Chelatococcus reniformis]|uniref:TNase-like domain-containing protein n=1 Tax=Chelatococcus reniformis TaxID=1494448 RepID=A0A916UJM0_9HYPH|nr:thermonuclease family protein [Chelatococcus reniformis]GGC73287.1 hypothetical protein GCM10010994_34580 [Chelatococcus reniformis]